ncbi:MAG: 3-oxoacyl-[acyl-carrier-protein] reductase [Spirochaetes bacterium]|nr:3-oxoacyl-[acyl-carrier-protein] reductase [Spirochaetota bacterium]
MMLLQGKKAIITGGSRGIGREIVLAYLKQGATVYYFDLMEGDSMGEYQKLAAEHGGKVAFMQVNVTDENAINAAVDAMAKAEGVIDILVNNAGITKDGLLMRMSTQDWDDVININLKSMFMLSRAVIRPMIRQKSGCIINMASIVGIMGNPGQFNYCASKAGMIGATKSLAREVGGKNIRVNAIAPGFIVSPMTDKLNDEQKKAMYDQIPAARFGEPAEVAKVCVFLASDLASYVTGEEIKVAGGLGM